MMQLNVGHLSRGPNGVGNASEASNVLITKTTQLTREPLPHLLHMGSTRHNQPKPTICTHFKPFMLPIRQGAVCIALMIGERGQHKAIDEGRAPRKWNGIKKGGHGGQASPTVQKCPENGHYPLPSHTIAIHFRL